MKTGGESPPVSEKYPPNLMLRLVFTASKVASVAKVNHLGKRAADHHPDGVISVVSDVDVPPGVDGDGKGVV